MSSRRRRSSIGASFDAVDTLYTCILNDGDPPVYGEPFGLRGASLDFSTCQRYPGGEIVVNPVNDQCTAGVEPRTWSQVRALFRTPPTGNR